MFSLVFDVLKWIGRRIGWLLVILAILWASWLVLAQLKDFSDLENNAAYLKNGQSNLKSNLTLLETQTKQSVAKMKLASEAQLKLRITELAEQIESKSLQLRELDSILTKLNPAKHLDVARLKIEIELMTQELEHLRYLSEISVHSSKLGRLAKTCEIIRQEHVNEWNAYQTADSKVAALTGIQAYLNPFSDEFKERKYLKDERERRADNTRNLKSRYEQCLADRVAAQRHLDGLEKAKEFVLKSEKTQVALVELDRNIQIIQAEAAKHWLKPILFDPLKQLFPVALGILASAILLPIVIKLCLFFVLAPIAEKQSPICLLPNTDARTQSRITDKHSAVSLQLEVEPDSELLVKPSYFHSAPSQCRIFSRHVLDNQFLMTSLAAGMYNLTAVQSDVPFVATLSSGQELLAELLQFEIGEGEAVCLHPSNLVGVVQQRGVPVQISSEWKHGSLQAWLTLQLRYLVFHGPASIIVKGCRGVRVEPELEGRAIEQVSTIGFSAHLNYSTSRTETFMAYLSGKKGLLRDRFSGQSGFFIYEEMPDPSKVSGVTGKGIGGVIDAVLKVFGI